MVTLWAKNSLPVSPSPRNNSTSNRLLIQLRTAFMRGSRKPRRDLQHYGQALQHQPQDGDGDKYLPAEPHDLIVAVTRERGPKPQEGVQKYADFEGKPDKAGPGEEAQGGTRQPTPTLQG